MMKKIALLACIAASSSQAGPADGVAEVSILPGWTTNAGTHMAAIRISLLPGWKTYWRAPGDAGIPPHIDFSASQNVAAAQFHWPTPSVFDDAGMRSIGYTDGVTVPIELTPQDDGAITLAGTMIIGVCEEICVPVQLSFDAMLPRGGARDSAIVASLIDRPYTSDEAGVTDVVCSISPMENGLTVTATLTMPPAGGHEVVVMEANDPMVWVSESDVTRRGDQITATSDMIHANADAFALDRSALRFTVFGADRVVDVQGCTAG